MFESVTTPLKIEAQVALDDLVVSLVVALSAMAGLAFVGIAVFYATYRSYGGLLACVAEGGYAVVVVVCAGSVLLVSRSRARRRSVQRVEERKMQQRQRHANAPPMWKDLGVISAVLPFLGKLAAFGLHNKKAAGGLAGSIATGFSLWRAVRAHRHI